MIVPVSVDWANTGRFNECDSPGLMGRFDTM